MSLLITSVTHWLVLQSDHMETLISWYINCPTLSVTVLWPCGDVMKNLFFNKKNYEQKKISESWWFACRCLPCWSEQWRRKLLHITSISTTNCCAFAPKMFGLSRNAQVQNSAQPDISAIISARPDISALISAQPDISVVGFKKSYNMPTYV